MARSDTQIKNDLKELARFLTGRYGRPVCENIFRIIDRRLSLGGRLLDCLRDLVAGQAVSRLLGNLNLAWSVAKFTTGIWGWCYREAMLETEPRTINPYSPQSDPDQYVTILIMGWQRGDFRYMPMGVIYSR